MPPDMHQELRKKVAPFCQNACPLTTAKQVPLTIDSVEMLVSCLTDGGRRVSDETRHRRYPASKTIHDQAEPWLCTMMDTDDETAPRRQEWKRASMLRNKNLAHDECQYLTEENCSRDDIH